MQIATPEPLPLPLSRVAAKRLELPLGTLKSRIRSGLKTLRTLLESR